MAKQAPTENATYRVASKADLFALPAREYGDVQVPAGPNGELMTVKVQSLTQKEWNEAQSRGQTTKATKGRRGLTAEVVNTPNLTNAYILQCGVIDPELSEDDCHLLLQRSPKIVNPILARINDLTGALDGVMEVEAEAEQFRDEQRPSA